MNFFLLFEENRVLYFLINKKKMKSIFQLFLLFLCIISVISFKLSAQHKLHSSEKNVMLQSGDRIDGRYRLVEKTNELTCPKMNEEW